jgi:DNA-binding GntR family transcriptional regulator
MKQKPVTFQTKEEYAYLTLRGAILDCELGPGEMLVIDRLSAEMEISTIPIRAAVQRLGMEGLVVIHPHAPARVAEISLSMIKETFTLLATLEQVAYEVVAENADPGQIDILESLTKEMDDAIAVDDPRLWAEKNIAFHRQIAEFSNMPLLIEFTHRTFDQWRRLSNFYFKNVTALRITQAQEEHRKIMDLIKKRRIEALTSLAKHHNQAAFESYQSLIQEQEE